MSSLKTKKVEDTVGKKPKFMYVPKNPPQKTNSSTNEGVASKTGEEVPNLNKNINKSTTLDSPNILNKLVLESTINRTSCTIEEIFDDLDDGYIDNT